MLLKMRVQNEYTYIQVKQITISFYTIKSLLIIWCNVYSFYYRVFENTILM